MTRVTIVVVQEGFEAHVRLFILNGVFLVLVSLYMRIP
jgi:hypothetical protein